MNKIRPDLPICRLHGVVVDSDNEAPSGGDMEPRAVLGSRLVGILLTFIETSKPS